jgi:hypothetical protein
MNVGQFVHGVAAREDGGGFPNCLEKATDE